ncbi:hypothetical protein LINGRAPRIM_LOCUS2117, partial [Linum grandiflorum]
MRSTIWSITLHSEVQMMQGQWRWKAYEIPYNSRENIRAKFCPER